ncbi:MAG: HD-GYP domain-containing protein [Candidatus Tyrphobacter sp.]
MDSSILHPATGLTESRSGVRDAILAASPDAGASVFGRAFAECFVDRVSEAIETDAWEPLVAWIGATYRRHGESRATRAMFLAAPRAIAKALEELDADPRVRDRFGNVAREVRAMVAGIPMLDAAVTSNALEEIDVIVSGMIGELQSIDPALAEQAQAVSAWCARIAAKVGLSSADTMKVTRGALVYDFGKSATPRRVLYAPRALTDDEWDLMRAHVHHGESAIGKMPQLMQFASIVRSHHERYDGLGYPDGLDAHRIPVTVRIVSVADAFNAMIAPRAYRPAMSPAQALDELRRGKGAQFDPNIVNAMLDLANGGNVS